MSTWVYDSGFDEDTDVQTRPDGLFASRYRPAGADTIPEMSPPQLPRNAAASVPRRTPQTRGAHGALGRNERNRTLRDFNFVDPELIETTPYRGPIRKVGARATTLARSGTGPVRRTG